MWSVLVASGLLLIADFSLRPSYCFQSYSDLSSLTNINNENLNLDSGDSDNKNYVQSKIYSAFDEFNKELEHYNHLGALIAWNISTTFSTKNLGITLIRSCSLSSKRKPTVLINTLIFLCT